MGKSATESETGPSEEEPLKRLGLSKQVVWDRVSGNHHCGTDSLVKLMESLELVLSYVGPAGWDRSSTKEQWYLPVFSSPERVSLNTVPPSLTFKFPCLSLLFFELLPLYWGLKQVNLFMSESVHRSF